MRLFRVFPYDASAAPSEKGGALYVPGSTAGRIANPDLYRELYLSPEPEGAVAEVLGRLPIWHAIDFVRPGGIRLGLVAYELSDSAPIFDLDNVKALEALGVERPSEVVIRNRKITQRWARRIFKLGAYIGARWWSYYNPAWTALGLWDVESLRFTGAAETLAAEHDLVTRTAREIVRQIVP